MVKTGIFGVGSNCLEFDSEHHKLLAKQISARAENAPSPLSKMSLELDDDELINFDELLADINHEVYDLDVPLNRKRKQTPENELKTRKRAANAKAKKLLKERNQASIADVISKLDIIVNYIEDPKTTTVDADILKFYIDQAKTYVGYIKFN